MENKAFTEKIREMIAEGETEKSLEELYHFVREADNEILDGLIMLRNRMKKLQRSYQNGVLDDESEFQERAKINEAILMYLRQLTPEYIALNKVEPEQITVPKTASPQASAPAGNMKLIYIGGGALVLLVVLVIILSKSFGSSGSGGDLSTMNGAPNSLTATDTYPKWAVVKTKSQDDLRIRLLPDENSGIVVNMPYNSRVKIVGADDKYVTVGNDYGKWMRVEYDDGNGRLFVGWAWGKYLVLTK